MDKLEAISTTLQSSEIDILKKYYKRGKEKSAQHFFWEKIDEELEKDYSTLKALDALGFIHLEFEEKSRGKVYTSYYLTLYSSAVFRAEYENYGKFRKWIVKQYLSYKDWIAFVGFVLSVFLFIIKLFEFFTP